MPFEYGLFTQDDFLQIDNVLYTPKVEELPHRRVFSLNTSYARYAQEIGYDYYVRNGKAKILASGGGAKDVPFVGESGGRITQKAFTIASGVRYTQDELEAIQAKRALGKGPAIQLDTLRVETARRYIFETECKLAFAGDANFGIKGIFDSSFYGTDLGTMENVAQGAYSGTAAEKRLWINKTSREKLTDLHTAMKTVQKDQFYKARVLVLPPEKYNLLALPFSDTGDSRTLLQWLNSDGMYFDQIVVTNQMKATNNGDTVDWFMVLDNDPMNVQLSLLYDIERGQPVQDIVGTVEMAVKMKTAGVIVRYPAAIYIGKGI